MVDNLKFQFNFKDEAKLMFPFKNFSNSSNKKEKLLNKKITKNPIDSFPFVDKIKEEKLDVNKFLNVEFLENRYHYKNNLKLRKKNSNWELKWIKIENGLEFSQDIWIKKWVRLTDPIINNKQETKIDNKKKEEQKFYKCKFDECGKIFNDSFNLKKHLATHGEKQFICPVEGCGKKFLDKSKLRRHNLVHSGEKQYKCEICGKRFSLDFNLKTHLRTHTGIKPYICRFPGCGKKFTQSSNLVAHEKVHNKVEGENGEIVKKKRGPPKKNPDEKKPKKEPGEKSKRGRKSNAEKERIRLEKEKEEEEIKKIINEPINLEKNEDNVENNGNDLNLDLN